MKNKEIILTKIDTVIAKLRAESNGSEQSISDIQAFERIHRQYIDEDIKGARHTYNFVMDTYLREMLPSECGEALGFTTNKLVRQRITQIEIREFEREDWLAFRNVDIWHATSAEGANPLLVKGITLADGRKCTFAFGKNRVEAAIEQERLVLEIEFPTQRAAHIFAAGLPTQPTYKELLYTGFCKLDYEDYICPI